MSGVPWRSWVLDMLAAIDAASEFVAGMTEESFRADAKTISAVTMQLVIIGEAASQMPDAFRDAHPDIPWRAIRGARNKAVHQYWGTDAGVLWLTITQSLPALRAALDAALEEAR